MPLRNNLARSMEKFKKTIVSLYPNGKTHPQIHRLLKHKILFAALLAMNESVALGAYRALADAGVIVPDNVSIISCDQFFDADFFIPRLTSVNQHNTRFGRYVIKTLLSVMSGITESGTQSCRPELVLRESCAPYS